MALHSCAHLALRCADAQETVDFYTGILGLPMTIADRVETYMGRECLYLHIFFKLADGNYIAFFDTPDFLPMKTKSDPSEPTFAPHYAYFAKNAKEVDDFKARLQQAGVEVQGPVVRPPFHSIYFHDPSGHRMEITAHIPTDDERYREDAAKANAVVKRWTEEKANRRHPSGVPA